MYLLDILCQVSWPRPPTQGIQTVITTTALPLPPPSLQSWLMRWLIEMYNLLDRGRALILAKDKGASKTHAWECNCHACTIFYHLPKWNISSAPAISKRQFAPTSLQCCTERSFVVSIFTQIRTWFPPYLCDNIAIRDGLCLSGKSRTPDKERIGTCLAHSFFFLKRQGNTFR